MSHVLLDQNVPVGVRPILQARDVRTVYQMGWAGLANGDLLDRAVKAGVEVFVTCDQNIAFQQNPNTTPMAVVILATNRGSVIQTQPNRIAGAIAAANRGACSVARFGRSTGSRQIRPLLALDSTKHRQALL